MKQIALAAALLLASMGSSSWAQSPTDHDTHHPDEKQSQPAPSAGPSGMMGSGGPQSMMGGGMMNMMGGNMPMNMIQMMGARQVGAGMGGMATIDRVEGRIAFLRTELRITDAQSSAWNGFADALRSNAKSLAEVRASMMSQQRAPTQNLVDRLDLQEKWLAARLEGTRAMKSALTSLAATFSDDQKKTADELLAPHMGMGMMAMTAGMQPGQMMQPGMGMMTQGQGR